MSGEDGPKVGYGGRHRLATIAPIWLLLSIITVLALLSVFLLWKSGTAEFLSGILAGVWIAVLVATWFVIWKERELKE